MDNNTLLNQVFTQEVEYNQGQEGTLIRISLICHNVPVGSLIELYPAEQNMEPSPPIVIPPTPVSTSPSFVVGVNSEIPGGYMAVFRYTVFMNQAPPESMQISLQAAYVEQS